VIVWSAVASEARHRFGFGGFTEARTKALSPLRFAAHSKSLRLIDR